MTRQLYEHMREATTEDLLAVLRFFDHPKVRQYYTGLIADIREQLKQRGVDPDPEPEAQLLYLEEVATRARAPLSSVRHWIRLGLLPSIRPGRRRLVRRTDLQRFLSIPTERKS